MGSKNKLEINPPEGDLVQNGQKKGEPEPVDETPSNLNIRKSGRKRTISVKMREKYLSPSPPPSIVKRTPKMNKSRVKVRVRSAKKEVQQNEMSMSEPEPSASSSFEMEQTLNPTILKINKRRANIPPQQQNQDVKNNIYINKPKPKVKRTRVKSYNLDDDYDWTVDFVKVKKATMPTKFECRHCQKTIGKAYLRSHKYTHTGEKPFFCPYDECERRFRANEELRRHLRVHTGEKPYPCRFPSCNQSFRLFDSRKNHELLHTPGQIKPYSCSMCQKRFARKDYKQNHERLYHPSNRKDTTNKVKINPTNVSSSTPANIKFSSLKSLNNSAASVGAKTKRKLNVRSKTTRQDNDWTPRVDHHRLMVMNKYRTTSKRRAEKNQERRSLKEEEEIVIKEEIPDGQNSYYPTTDEREEEAEETPEEAEPEKSSVTKIIAIVFSESTEFEGDPTDPMLITNELEVPTTTTTETTTEEH